MDILIIIVLIVAIVLALIGVPSCLYFCIYRVYCKQKDEEDCADLKVPPSVYVIPTVSEAPPLINQHPKGLRENSIYTIEDDGYHSTQDGRQYPYMQPETQKTTTETPVIEVALVTQKNVKKMRDVHSQRVESVHPVPLSYRDMLVQDRCQNQTKYDSASAYTLQGNKQDQKEDSGIYTIQNGHQSEDSIYTIQDGRQHFKIDGGVNTIPYNGTHGLDNYADEKWSLVKNDRRHKLKIARQQPYLIPKTHGSSINNRTEKMAGISLEERTAMEEYKLKCDQKLIEYREIQAQIIEEPYSSPQYSLLICVDARPSYIDVLPWDLHDKSRKGDAGEFEMKNLMFALLLWEDQIISVREVQIHTDNSAIKPGRKNMYGFRVSDFIQHLRKCEGVKTNKNQDVHINGELNPIEFAKYIIPADDLSRWRVKECQDFLTNVYQIYRFKMTHTPKPSNSSLSAKTWYVPTSHYQEFIHTVKERLKRWRRNPCIKCGFMVGSSASLCPSVEE